MLNWLWLIVVHQLEQNRNIHILFLEMHFIYFITWLGVKALQKLWAVDLEVAVFGLQDLGDLPEQM